MRQLFTLASALSLVLCLAGCVLWVRSYWIVDEVQWLNPTAAGGAQSRWGQIEISHSWGGDLSQLYHFESAYKGFRYHRYSRSSPSKQGQFLSTWGGIRENWQLGGFRWFIADGGRGTWALNYMPTWSIALPDWAMVLLCGVFPSLWLLRLYKQRRLALRPNIGPVCPNCGYDVRATPDRCPECGTSIRPNEQQPSGSFTRRHLGSFTAHIS